MSGFGDISAQYDYRGAAGELSYQVVRLVPKDFRFRRPKDGGGWIWNLGNTKKLLFRLPQLLSADPDVPVFITEGEKDVQTVEKLGLVATTACGGADAKWLPSYTERLEGRLVVILPDNDDPGRRRAEGVASALVGHAASVRILALPGLEKKGDVTDWVEAGGTREDLLSLVETTESWNPTQAAPLSESGAGHPALPEIITNGRPQREVTSDILRVLLDQNDPPRIFERADHLCRVRRDAQGRPRIDDLTEHMLRGEMDRAADFKVVNSRGDRRSTTPSLDLVRDLAALPGWGFTVLEALAEIPVLRPDGTVLDQPGYDPRTGLYYSPTLDLVVPPIPESPTRADAAAALAVVIEVLRDFPFADDASCTNAVGLMLTPIVRPMILGPTPLALMEAPTCGTGKTLLAEAIAVIATGNSRLQPVPRKDEEWRKVLTSILLAGWTIVILDNLRDTVRSTALEAILTSTTLQDRLLGSNRMLELPQRATWVATANNAQIGGDLLRRCYLIRLDARMSRPWQGREFKHEPLLGWVREHRGELVAALLTMARAWVVAGRPAALTPVLGKFESWCQVVGGILSYVGDPHFLGNLEQMYEAMDEESAPWEAFLREILQKMGDQVWTVSTLVGEFDSPEGGESLQKMLPDELKEAWDAARSSGARGGFSRKLGIALKGHKEIRYGDTGIHLVPSAKDPRTSSARWQVAEEQKMQKS